jgi:hypothetical protein
MTNVDKVVEILDIWATAISEYPLLEGQEQQLYPVPTTEKIAKQIDALYGGWVSVDERLPENSDWVLYVCALGNKNPESGLASYDIVDERFYYTDNFDWIAGVTHWQSLPSPPNE